MCEGLVGVGLTVDVLALVHGGALSVEGVHEFDGETLVHGPALLGAGGVENPPNGERLFALGADRYRHLVVAAADAPAANLDMRLDVLDSGLEHLDRRLVGDFLADPVEGPALVAGVPEGV